MNEDEAEHLLSSREAKKKAKKVKKKRMREHVDETKELSSSSLPKGNEKGEEKKKNRDSKKILQEEEDVKVARRKKRRLEREALLDKVPRTDEHGVAYTKQQIRRMRKRIARGLDPIETPVEKHARLVQDAQLRKEEEAELAGMLIQKSDGPQQEGSDDEEDEDDREHDNSNLEDDEEGVEPDNDNEETFSYEKTPKDAAETLAEQPPRKKKKRSKPVPTDYVCSACNNAVGPPHWIYDCSNKKTVPGTNQVSRKQRGLHNPSDTKLFVSGLPFDATVKDVLAIFQSKGDVAVQHCKLIKFEDTGRCKGQAFLTFDTADAAKRALRLNGTVIDNPAPPQLDPKRTKDAVVVKEHNRKDLKLKVTKVLNRFLTKSKK